MKSWLYEKSIKIKTLFLLMFFISIYGCTVEHHVHNEITPPVETPSQNQSGSNEIAQNQSGSNETESCSLMYNIYAKCFGVGIGSDSNKCKTLAAAMAYEFKSKLPDNGGKLLGLMCGIACIEGSQNSGLLPYSEFAKEYCKQ